MEFWSLSYLFSALARAVAEFFGMTTDYDPLGSYTKEKE